MKKFRKRKLSSFEVTLLLFVVLFLIVSCTWSLFVSGPARLHEANLEAKYQKIRKDYPGVMGLTCHIFDYVTYNGYNDDTLYWFDDNGELITKREIMDLDYDRAKTVAKEEYGIDCKSIELAYGYNNPCYEIKGTNGLILIDFDTFVRVYEREV